MAKIVNGKLKKNYRLAFGSAQLIQYGLPLSYIAVRYEIFGSSDAGKVSLGWLTIILATIYFMFKKNIKTFINEYNNNLGEVAKTARWGFGFLTTALVFALASYWIMGAIWLLITFGASNLISLAPYSVYYKRKKEYDELATAIKTKQKEVQIQGVSL